MLSKDVQNVWIDDQMDRIIEDICNYHVYLQLLMEGEREKEEIQIGGMTETERWTMKKKEKQIDNYKYRKETDRVRDKEK